MRITFVLAAFDLSGGERVISEYAQALQDRGHEVFAVARAPFRPGLRERLRGALRGRWQPKHAQTPPHFDRTTVPHRETDRFRIVDARDVPDADVVIAAWWETANWINDFPASKGAKVHFIQHYEAFEYTSKDGVDAALQLPFPKIVIASWLETLLREDLGVSDVTLVPNAVDSRLFNAPPRAKQAVPTVGMLYSTTPWKGGRDGLAAFARLRERMPNARLVTFGTERPGPALPVPDGTEHHRAPPQAELKDIYARCDVWLCPSISEGFGLPPLEAMACRCPVVSTRMGGPADFVVPGENGFLASVGDVDGLAAQLQRVLALSPTDWRAMSDAAQATATGYTLAMATDRFEAALTSAVEQARSAA